MVVDVVQLTLDYGSLDSDTLTFVQELDAELDLVLKWTAEKLGHILLKAKKGLPHGLYMPWIASKGISETTAWRCMQVAQGKEVKSFKMKDLDVEVVEPHVEPAQDIQQVATIATIITNEDKRRTVIEQMTKDSTQSDRQIARLCGVSKTFVSHIRKELFPKTVSKITRKTAPKSEPKAQPPSNSGTPVPEVIDGQEIPETANTPETEQPIPAMEPQQAEPPQETTQAPTPVKPSQKETPRNVDGIPVNIPHISSKSNEWYTPAIYIEAIRKVLGGIDLDPASCEEANQIVKAEKYYDLATNGLDKPWKGRVFLNPPYGRDEAGSNQEIWTGQLIDQYTKQNTSEAILLVNAAVDTNWFQRLFAYPVCLMRGRINFYSPSDSDSGATHGSAFVYFGPEEKQRKFVQIFNEFGTVVKRWY